MQRLASLIAATTLLSASAPAQNVPYPTLTNNRREVVNFNAEIVRGLAQASDSTLYSLNSHASLITHHTSLFTPDAAQLFQTILNPVAIALWRNDRIVVTGAGTHALALHDRTTGEILNVLQLPSEPADLVIDPSNDAAFVACQGSNQLVRIDLNSFTITDTYEVPAERPRFLFLDLGGNPTNPAAHRVIVASFLSGNGSLAVNSLVQGARTDIVDSYAFPPPAPSLPDQDLFSVATTTGATLAPVKKRVGTMLTAHGLHPDGTYWALNVDSQNQDPLRQSEPELRGDFVENRAWIGPLSASLTQTSASEFRDLDRATPTSSYSSATAVAFPYGIAFGPAVSPSGANPPSAGLVYVTSPLDDCISIRNSAGDVVGRIDLPAGSIPLDVEVEQLTKSFLFVHCWGSNDVLFVPATGFLTVNATNSIRLDLGLDPTPEPIRRGREIWYDGHRSMNARTSCNSCHPGGKNDLLGWQISDDPTDRKDVMVTQSLLSIEDTFPYHWRGERALIDFNGAFVDLLGSPAPLTTGQGSEFEAFQAFVFSLQAHANPHQELTRDLPDVSDVVGFVDDLPRKGKPVQGLDLYQTRIGFNGQTCLECHSFETGSNGDFINEAGSDIPSAQVLEVAHLRELRHRDQRDFLPFSPSTAFAVPRSGFSIAHNGVSHGILGFVLNANTFNLDDEESAHVAAFVRRFDQGISPAAHFGLFVDANTFGDPRINDVLLAQSLGITRGIDLVAFGTFVPPNSPPGAAPVFARFVRSQTFDPVLNVHFLCSELAPNTTVGLGTLLTQAQSGQAKLTFLGLPPGSGRRFALDPDNDDLTDFEERTQTPLPTFPFVADSDGDGQPDGAEVKNIGGDPRNENVQAFDLNPPAFSFGQLDFVSASVAKFHFEASEHVRVETVLNPGAGPQRTASNPVMARSHTVVLQGLAPSTPSVAPGAGPNGVAVANVGSITILDRADRPLTFNFSVFGGNMLYPQLTSTTGVPADQAPLIVKDFQGSILTGAGAMKISSVAKVEQRFSDLAGLHVPAIQGSAALFQVVRETSAGENLYKIDTGATSTLASTNLIKLEAPDGTTRVIDAQGFPGPFFVAPLLADGSVKFDATVTGLGSGQRVRVRVIAIAEPVSFPDTFREVTFGRYQLPATAPEHRGLEFVMP